MSEKAKIVTISEFYIDEFNSRCNHLFEVGYSMIHYSVAGLPKVHKYGDDIFYVLYTAVFELRKEHYGERWKDYTEENS